MTDDHLRDNLGLPLPGTRSIRRPLRVEVVHPWRDEWFKRRVMAEGDHEIGAGRPVHVFTGLPVVEWARAGRSWRIGYDPGSPGGDRSVAVANAQAEPDRQKMIEWLDSFEGHGVEVMVMDGGQLMSAEEWKNATGDAAPSDQANSGEDETMDENTNVMGEGLMPQDDAGPGVATTNDAAFAAPLAGELKDGALVRVKGHERWRSGQEFIGHTGAAVRLGAGNNWAVRLASGGLLSIGGGDRGAVPFMPDELEVIGPAPEDKPSPVIEPTIGRIVIASRLGEPGEWPAIIDRVHSDPAFIDMTVFGFNSFSAEYVERAHLGPNGHIMQSHEGDVWLWRWMDYQLGQAAKADELTKALRADVGDLKQRVIGLEEGVHPLDQNIDTLVGGLNREAERRVESINRLGGECERLRAMIAQQGDNIDKLGVGMGRRIAELRELVAPGFYAPEPADRPIEAGDTVRINAREFPDYHGREGVAVAVENMPGHFTVSGATGLMYWPEARLELVKGAQEHLAEVMARPNRVAESVLDWAPPPVLQIGDIVKVLDTSPWREHRGKEGRVLGFDSDKGVKTLVALDLAFEGDRAPLFQPEQLELLLRGRVEPLPLDKDGPMPGFPDATGLVQEVSTEELTRRAANDPWGKLHRREAVVAMAVKNSRGQLSSPQIIETAQLFLDWIESPLHTMNDDQTNPIGEVGIDDEELVKLLDRLGEAYLVDRREEAHLAQSVAWNELDSTTRRAWITDSVAHLLTKAYLTGDDS